jgi:hypothetical protein
MLGVGNCEQDVMTKHVPRGVIIQAEIGGKESKDDRRPSKIFETSRPPAYRRTSLVPIGIT